MRTQRPLAVLGLLLLFAVLAGGAATGSSPPTSLCGVCEDPEWHDDRPMDGYRAGDGSVTVAVFDNGTTRWTERVGLNDSGDVALSNPEYRQRLVRESHEGYVVNDPDTFETAVENGTLVVQYRAEGVRTGPGGVVLFEGFYDPGTSYRLDAERLTVRGPEGTTPVGDPAHASVENGSVVYTGGSAVPSAQTLLAFDEDGGLLSQVERHLLVALAFGPRILSDVLTTTGGTVVVWALAAAVLDWFVAPTRRTWRPLRLADGGRGTDEAESGTVRWFLAGGLLSAATLLFLLPAHTTFAVLAVVPAALLWVALGMARTPRQWWAALAGLLSTPALFVLPMTPLYGLGLGLTTLFVTGGGVVFLAVGGGLFVLGRRASRSDTVA